MKTPTRRQAEAIALVAQGMTAKEIAAQLGVAVATAQTMLVQARERVGAKTAAHLVAISITKGFICTVLCISMLAGLDDGYRNRAQQRMTRRVQVTAIYA